jgi:hypothetical protein
VALAVLPHECRPVAEQHMLGYTGAAERQVKVSLRPDGNVLLMSDGGLQSWFIKLEGESTPGVVLADTSAKPVDVMPVIRPYVPPARPYVAITIPMTSYKMSFQSAEESPLMRIVLPSLMRSLSLDLVHFKVVVYAGYDTKDLFWVGANKMDRIFTTKVKMPDGTEAKGTLSLRWIQCDCESMVCNTNCISKVAYRDGADFFFRSNDDTEFMTNLASTHNWISSFVEVLASYVFFLLFRFVDHIRCDISSRSHNFSFAGTTPRTLVW